MILLFLACVCFGLWYWSKVREFEAKAGGVPDFCDKPLSVFGYCTNLIGDTEHLYQVIRGVGRSCNERGGFTKVRWLGPYFAFMVTDPEVATKITNACLEKARVYNFAQKWVGMGVFLANTELWKLHRKLLNPSFNQHMLSGYQTVFNDQSVQLVQALEVKADGKEFDIWPYLAKNGLETVCQTMLACPEAGENIADDEYAGAVHSIFNVLVSRFQRFWMYPDAVYRWTSTAKREKDALKVVMKKTDKFLQKKKNNLGDKDDRPGRYKAFMNHMLDLQADGVVSEQQTRDEVNTMIAAGFDTTATALLFSCVCIGAHPDVQERIYSELLEVVGDVDRDITPEDLSQLVYMEAVLKECLRLYPVGPAILRYALSDIVLDTCTIPAGSVIAVLIADIHQHSSWGPDAAAFDPQRFLEPGRLPPAAGAFSAFGVGRRNCIGKTYAMLAMKTTMARLLRRYRVRADRRRLRVKFDLVLRPVAGHHVTLEIR